MRKIGTGHGPAVVLEPSEMDMLFRASEILKEARVLESDEGTLGPSDYPEVAVAESALTVVQRYFQGIHRYAVEKNK